MSESDRGGGLGGESLTPPIPDNWKLPDLRIDRDGDGYFIQTRVRIPVKVDDTPFVVTRVELRGEELHAYLNDGADERLDPASLRLGADEVPYASVKQGAFDARFSRAAAWQLLQIADYDEVSGMGTLRLRGTEWPLRRAS